MPIHCPECLSKTSDLDENVSYEASLCDDCQQQTSIKSNAGAVLFAISLLAYIIVFGIVYFIID